MSKKLSCNALAHPQVNSMERFLNRLFNHFSPLSTWDELFDSHNLGLADIDLQEAEITVSLPLPGVKKDDIAIELNNDYLTIESKMCEEKSDCKDKNGRFIRQERVCRNYNQTVKLPCPVIGESAKAKYTDGVLTVNFQRNKRAAAEAKAIKID
ncbi:MAG: Hsp20/alpha crystallin family protein [Victivallaceae bacterium]